MVYNNDDQLIRISLKDISIILFSQGSEFSGPFFIYNPAAAGVYITKIKRREDRRIQYKLFFKVVKSKGWQ